MGAFFVYILKSAVCLAIFYLFYRLLLSKETFHRLNRITLLTILALVCIIPLIRVTLKGLTDVNQHILSWEELLLMAELNSDIVAETAPMPDIPWREMMVMVYVIGIVFFLLRHVWALFRMLKLIKGSKIARQMNGVTLITHQKNIAPFSWMRFVVISEADLNENGEEILMHECAHISKKHSIDLLIADICIFFQWFNPASWLLKQELQNIHEFEADECVINQGIDAKKYQLLLIKKAVGTRLYSMANSFNHSSLKKRITMMLKKKSNPWARLKYFYVFPLTAIAVAAFARPEISKGLDEFSVVKVNDLAAIIKTNEVKSIEFASLVQPSQKMKISGKVLDKVTKTPIAGASILIAGTTSGTVSDLDGKFKLELEAGSVLQISYINYALCKMNIPAGTKTVEVLLEKNESDVRYIPTDQSYSYTNIEAVFQVVEEMPEFPGGMSECLSFLSKNVKYPAEAVKDSVQGKVIIQFVVDKDGSAINPKVVRSVHPALDNEAIRVVSVMPKWKPGRQRGEAVRVKYTIPVAFKLDGNQVKDSQDHSFVLKIDSAVTDNPLKFQNGSFFVKESDAQPLVVVDGKKISAENLGKIEPTQISSINVKRSSSGISQYGEDGKNGVIVITLKKKQ